MTEADSQVCMPIVTGNKELVVSESICAVFAVTSIEKSESVQRQKFGRVQVLHFVGVWREVCKDVCHQGVSVEEY